MTAEVSAAGNKVVEGQSTRKIAHLQHLYVCFATTSTKLVQNTQPKAIEGRICPFPPDQAFGRAGAAKIWKW